MKTRALWLNFDEGYNIWAYQVFAAGETEEERFLPEDYFLGKGERGDLRSYGSCHTEAERFAERMRLPFFLWTLAEVRRDKHLATSLKRIAVRLQSGEGRQEKGT